MEHGTTLVAIVHIIIAFFLVVIVLLQDSKGGGMGGSFGGGSNQSIFGATGATSFLVKVTRFLAIGFMVTCILLTVMSSRKTSRSVIDSLPAGAMAPKSAPATEAAAGAAAVPAPADTKPATPTTPANKAK